MSVRVVLLACLVAAVAGRPQAQQQNQPMNYDFKWNVDAQDYDNYYGQQEAANNGRVDGSYYVWMPDGRLMVVTYYVDGDSGFVPTINYIDDYKPTWGTPYYQNRK
ncbi:uncharacterized protein LOC126999412 [Eriocheir sinensis]|uniref:uncharacterized protein LOC126999412 n=1 Tax=Eriocheir sinensis TaxID=95602 RepID=UPI0021C94764|nr:uncharacterized protein LOC126999412 [Eriocheir sinensis]